MNGEYMIFLNFICNRLRVTSKVKKFEFKKNFMSQTYSTYEKKFDAKQLQFLLNCQDHLLN